MYRRAFIDLLAAVLAVIALDAAFRILRRQERLPKVPKTGQRFLTLLRFAVNLAGFACFAAVAGSGFLAVLDRQTTLSGSRLIAHMVAAPVFAVSSVVTALFWTHRNQFTASDWVSLHSGSHADESTWTVVLRKLFFWVALAFAVPTLLSVLAAMFPLATPAQQQYLFLIHRACALPLATAGLLFAYFALMSWLEGRT